MALAPFFDRIYGAVGSHVPVSRESLTQKLMDITVGVRCTLAASQNNRWIADFVTNLAARLYPRLSIAAGDDTAGLRKLASNINPDIEFSDHAPAATTISVANSVD